MAPGEALALGRAAHVDALADQEMRRTTASPPAPAAHRRRRGTRRASPSAPPSPRAKWPLFGLDHVLHLGPAPAELHRRVAVLSPAVRAATTCTSSRCSTVTGTCVPSSLNSRVMPSFFASNPVRIFVFPRGAAARGLLSLGPNSALQLDLDVHAGREVELHQRVHRLRRRLDDVEQPAMRCGSRTARGSSCRRAASGSR